MAARGPWNKRGSYGGGRNRALRGGARRVARPARLIGRRRRSARGHHRSRSHEGLVDGDLVKVKSWYDNEWGYAKSDAPRSAVGDRGCGFWPGLRRGREKRVGL